MVWTGTGGVLFGVWRWSKRRYRAEMLSDVAMTKSEGKVPSEKRTEDSAEDLGLDARGPPR